MLYLRQIYGIGRAHVMSDDGYIGEVIIANFSSINSILQAYN